MADESADQNALFLALLEIADDHLILGHRLSEWCGHAPMLEEDLSMPNMALDLLGQAQHLYAYAAEVEGLGRTEDDIAFLRTDREYRNCLLVEKPNVDFAHTVLKQFYFSVFMHQYWQHTTNGHDQRVVGVAAKGVKEYAYHVKHCAEWLIRLGDGTAESAQRMQSAVDELHVYTGELFNPSEAMRVCIDNEQLTNLEPLIEPWNSVVHSVFEQALLQKPEELPMQAGGRNGMHTEAFGHILSQLQYMQRTYPGASW